ncbi:Morphology and auto-aggregation control protein [Thalassovita gelatinovora]|uniref:Morphology and auto-aggregation control protein n=1 Tax=Thalassovita gelatinovora TaxID=53501 RepID=A0A0P1FJI3_THAGE|nr:LysR family transcriptional regulator [Thalassovita gelatinovora]QIZ81673.1 LysR family transcriptional regulator [Thalassovita gelatinovora]CUH68193.1 Morphology and auto-aggregation control protein [Thalassovita gelatinovora]SEQ30926.1 DNA-binding transcriptional regulator, LysR family [Thalassovita gelatinovora]
MIDKLEMFIALSRERHFGRAAESCGVTQPSLSAAIKQLEDQLGVMLVYRGSRFQGLTPEGQRVLDWARQIVGDARTMKEEMRAARQGLSGNLRLAVIPTALTLVADLTATFTKAHPKVRFTILSRTSIEILSMLENLQIDAGLTYLDNEPLGRVSTVPIYAERYALILRHDHPLADRPQIGWEDLTDLSLCLLTPDMQNRRIITQHLSEAGIEAEPMIEASSLIVLISHVLKGGWATILPVKAAEVFLMSGELAAIPLQSPDASHRVGLIAPYREPHTPVLAALLDQAASLSDRFRD